MLIVALRRALGALAASVLLLLVFAPAVRAEPVVPSSAIAEALRTAQQAARQTMRSEATAVPVPAVQPDHTAQVGADAAATPVRQTSSRGQNAVAARPAAPPDKVRVPILMYHHVASAPAGADAVRRDLSVSPGAFTEQMQYLSKNGYQTITLANLLDHVLVGTPLPARPIILTFDDGYDDNYNQAYPILHGYGFTGVFFVLTDFVGQPGYASWEQIVAMSRNGMDIQAHGRTHADLAISGAEDATWQIAGSRSVLEEKLGRPVQFYCYPSGRYTPATIALLRANGYRAAVTIAYGATHTAAGAFELDRVRVRGTDTLEQFAIKVETAP